MLTTITAAALIALAPLAGPQEDDPGWDCRTMGDRVCGATNSQGVQAGCYNDQAALVAAWPCHIVVNPDGSADVYDGPAS